jgi:hypothetical protein
VTRDKRGKKACPARQIPAGAIEDFVVERLREVTADGNLTRDVQQALHKRVQGQREAMETEHRALPKEIARLSAEGRTLVETLGQARDAAHRLLEERIEDIGDQLATHERRIEELDRALALLERAEVETSWVAEMLTQFDMVWEIMTLENRARLVRAIVQRVEVDEESGQVTAVLVDLGVDDDGGTQIPVAAEGSQSRMVATK